MDDVEERTVKAIQSPSSSRWPHSILYSLLLGSLQCCPPFPGLKLPILLNPVGYWERQENKCLAEHAVCAIVTTALCSVAL